MICFITYVLNLLASDRSTLISPEVLTTETDCVEVWNNEEKCNCQWVNAQTSKTSRNMQRKANRLNEAMDDFYDKSSLRGDDNEVKVLTNQEDENYYVRKTFIRTDFSNLCT